MGEQPVADTVAEVGEPSPAAAVMPPALTRFAAGPGAAGTSTRPAWRRPTAALVTVLAVGVALLIMSPWSTGREVPTGIASTANPTVTATATPAIDAAAAAGASASAEASSSSAAARSAELAATRSHAFAGMRGIVQNLAWWNATYPTVPISECELVGMWEYWETPGPNASAWRLPSGALACADPALPAWEGRIVGIQVFFSEAVDEAMAVAVASSLLPADITPSRTLAGNNADYSRVFGGSCMHYSFDSTSLGTVVRALDSDWPDSRRSSVTLYSGLQTAEGSDSQYRPDSVHLASVGIGQMKAGVNPNGTANC